MQQLRAAATTASRFPEPRPFIIKHEPEDISQPQQQDQQQQPQQLQQQQTLKPFIKQEPEDISQQQQQQQQQQTSIPGFDEYQKQQQQLLLQQYQDKLEKQLRQQQLQVDQQLRQQQHQVPQQHQEQQHYNTQQNSSKHDTISQSGNPSKPQEVTATRTQPGIEPTTFIKSDSDLISSIEKTTVLRGLVREYIDSQRGILEIYQVGHNGLLTEPVAGNFKLVLLSLCLSIKLDKAGCSQNLLEVIFR